MLTVLLIIALTTYAKTCKFTPGTKLQTQADHSYRIKPNDKLQYDDPADGLTTLLVSQLKPRFEDSASEVCVYDGKDYVDDTDTRCVPGLATKYCGLCSLPNLHGCLSVLTDELIDEYAGTNSGKDCRQKIHQLAYMESDCEYVYNLFQS